MAQIVLKRGTTKQLEATPLQDGLLSFTTDDGRLHMDYVDSNGELKRKTFYSGKLTFGEHVFDGTQDVDVDVYNGSFVNEE